MKKTLLKITIWTSILTFFGCNSTIDSSMQKEDKIEMMDPNDFLMTISTIENTLPSTNSQPKDSIDLEILEDDWRQIEFILKKYQQSINQEIDSINLIIENESIEIGDDMIAFKNLHVRKLIPTPLDDGIELENLKKSFNTLKTGSLSFSQYGTVNNGVYFNISNFQLYGLIDDSKVTTFSFYGLTSWDALSTFKEEIKNLMGKYNLVLVDWRLRKVIDINGINDFIKPSN